MLKDILSKGALVDGTVVSTGTFLFDTCHHFAVEIADRKGPALRDMDRAERNGALGKLKKTGIGHAPERTSYMDQPGYRTKGILVCKMSRPR